MWHFITATKKKKEKKDQKQTKQQQNSLIKSVLFHSQNSNLPESPDCPASKNATLVSITSLSIYIVLPVCSPIKPSCPPIPSNASPASTAVTPTVPLLGTSALRKSTPESPVCRELLPEQEAQRRLVAAALFSNGRHLMRQRDDGGWCLPG